MVGPSLSGPDRRRGMTRLKASVVLLVAASGALVALYADAPLVWVAGGALGGTLAGLVLWQFLKQSYREGTSRRDPSHDEEPEKRERFK